MTYPLFCEREVRVRVRACTKRTGARGVRVFYFSKSTRPRPCETHRPPFCQRPYPSLHSAPCQHRYNHHPCAWERLRCYPTQQALTCALMMVARCSMYSYASAARSRRASRGSASVRRGIF